MARQRRLIRHRNNILSRQRLSFPSISPGMVVEFTYKPDKDQEILDKFPLVLVLYREAKRGGAGGLLSGLNLNYMYDNRIKYMAKLLSKPAPLIETNKVTGKQLRKEYNKFSLSTSYRGINSSQNIFKKIINPRILKTDDCYRSYNEMKIKNLMVCKYNFGLKDETDET
tara:strand:- start:799 stop:1305 length:507 start_codon:yes stop_codon:yes gene_type:complete